MRRAVLASLLIATLTAVGGTATVAYADTSYPSWGDVQAAKASQAATQAEVDNINTLLAGLQSSADQASMTAITRAAEYAKAQENLAAATATATQLRSQADAATATADTLRTRSGALTEQLSRSGGQDLQLNVFLSGKASGQLLYQLGAVSKLEDQASSLFTQATVQSNTAHALSSQADVAAAARDKLASAAHTSLVAAQAAQQAAEAELAKQKAAGDVLYAQLASLKNTTAAVEQGYAQGLAAALAYQNQQHSTGSANSFAPPPGVVVNPTAARAYAASVIGSYGWDSGQMTCLTWLWNRESGWRADAYNTSSGAYGIAQALPAIKMASAGADWATNADTQINWGLGYIASRYGSPCAAWAHETSNNWY
ncbi:MAG: peptidoglycan DL-endopeptidase CwlO [Microbacteriaceae bacterium]|nr:peptidoglycan DL-endopeptidase CwlO [Microbacteriaceae bacterium]